MNIHAVTAADVGSKILADAAAAVTGVQVAEGITGPVVVEEPMAGTIITEMPAVMAMAQGIITGTAVIAVEEPMAVAAGNLKRDIEKYPHIGYWFPNTIKKHRNFPVLFYFRSVSFANHRRKQISQ